MPNFTQEKEVLDFLKSHVSTSHISHQDLNDATPDLQAYFNQRPPANNIYSCCAALTILLSYPHNFHDIINLTRHAWVTYMAECAIVYLKISSQNHDKIYNHLSGLGMNYEPVVLQNKLATFFEQFNGFINSDDALPTELPAAQLESCIFLGLFYVLQEQSTVKFSQSIAKVAGDSDRLKDTYRQKGRNAGAAFDVFLHGYGPYCRLDTASNSKDNIICRFYTINTQPSLINDWNSAQNILIDICTKHGCKNAIDYYFASSACDDSSEDSNYHTPVINSPIKLYSLGSSPIMQGQALKINNASNTISNDTKNQGKRSTDELKTFVYLGINGDTEQNTNNLETTISGSPEKKRKTENKNSG